MNLSPVSDWGLLHILIDVRSDFSLCHFFLTWNRQSIIFFSLGLIVSKAVVCLNVVLGITVLYLNL